jgi:hypothetical protein
MRKLLMTALIGCMLIVFSACGQTEDVTEADIPVVVEDVEPVIIEPEEEIVEEEPELPFKLALTGEGSEIENKARPVMVLVENSPAARPQSGLHQADIVYEVLSEGDITRFLAIYQSESPEVIGPVRSARDYFIRIADGLDSLIVHAGWSPDAQKLLTGQGRPNINQLIGGDHAYYWRSSERKAPHNLYTSMEKIRQGAEDKKYRDEGKDLNLKFADADHTIDGDKAGKVKVNYINGYYVSYEYDEAARIYNRYMLGKAHKDKESDIQITASNILVLESSHKVLDKAGRRDVNIAGPGNGRLVQKGIVQEITWQSTDGIIRAYKDEVEIPLVPGKTWIHIVPIGSKLDVEL